MHLTYPEDDKVYIPDFSSDALEKIRDFVSRWPNGHLTVTPAEPLRVNLQELDDLLNPPSST